MNRLGLLHLLQRFGTCAILASATPASALSIQVSQNVPPPTPPSAWQLVLEGAALALPDYVLQLAMHEGSHALAAVILGGEVTGMELLPKRVDGTIRFGETTWKGNFTPTETAVTLLAPKILDMGLIAAYTALLHSDAYPSNKHVQLTLLVVATGAWIDFSKELVLRDSTRDLPQIFETLGIPEDKQWPYQIAYGALSLAGAFQLGQGFYRLFKAAPLPATAINSTDSSTFETLSHLVVTPRFVGLQGTF